MIGNIYHSLIEQLDFYFNGDGNEDIVIIDPETGVRVQSFNTPNPFLEEGF